MIANILRRLRGALGNALVWAPTWFIVAFPLTAVFHVFGYFGSAPFWPTAFGTATTLAGMGFLAGGAFSLYLGFAARHQRLKDLKPTRSALGSGITAGLVIPAFGILVNTLGGAPISVGTTVVISSIAAVLTGVTAFGHIKIAQKALLAGELPPEELDSGTDRFLLELDGDAI